MSDIQATIEEAFERRADITPRNAEPLVKEATQEAIDMLDRGVARSSMFAWHWLHHWKTASKPRNGLNLI